MSPDQFRALGTQMVNWVADYWQQVESLPVLSTDGPGDGLARLPDMPPELGSDDAGWQSIFNDLTSVMQPGLTHWQHPSFYGFFPCNASGPAVLGELLSAGLGIQGMLWQTSPIATELEIRMLDWMAHAFGLPETFRSQTGTGGGCIQGTASEATLVALLAARQRARARGVPDSAMTLYTSVQAHSSVIKAAMIAGLAKNPQDRDRLRLITTDAQHRLCPLALRDAMEQDVAAGLVPIFVSLTSGTTSSGAFDPIDAVCDAVRDVLPKEQRAWVHVDAAWAGVAAACPEHRWFFAGLERVDSLCINPHKWLLTNFDCDLFWVADRKDLLAALSITPEYLRNDASDQGAVIDYRDWQIPLGRRFRALKLWFVVRHYGLAGLRSYIRQHCDWAAWLEEQVVADPRFELACPRSLSLICLHLKAGDTPTRELLARINATGLAYCTHTTLSTPPDQDGNGGGTRYVIRVCIGSATTTQEHVRAFWTLLSEHADAVLAVTPDPR